MNYSIIKQPDELRQFINWLPCLAEDETYYLCLFARKKYCNDPTQLLADKQQLKRFTTNKERMLEKIRQLECEIGTYYQKNVPVPPESLALYITPNPRSCQKAAKASLIKLAEVVTQPYNGYNPHSLIMNQLQVACGTKHFIDLDFDTEDPEDIARALRAVITPGAMQLLRTRGGLHALIEPHRLAPALQKSWYSTCTRITGCDARGDNLIPVPGCSQGGFVPYFMATKL